MSDLPEVIPREPGLFHSVFLERAALDSAQESRVGQGAFLVLRLIDNIAATPQAGVNGKLFRYQAAATERYCRDQMPPGTEVDQLLGLVAAASEAHRQGECGLIAPSMLAYARQLEDSARYDEALDVLETLQRVAGSSLAPAHAILTALQEGRTSRKIARFDRADTAYRRAHALAVAVDDRSSEMLSRLGRANVLWGRGNLLEAERWNREVLEDARATGARDVEAIAEHCLGTVLGVRGQVADAVSHFWRANELYRDEPQQLLALHDLGLALARLGAIHSAEIAFQQVVARSPSQSNVQNAVIELMHCASFRRDHVTFQRWRTRCEEMRARMAPNILADYHLKAGVGLARFGTFNRAVTELEQALAVAQANMLHEFEFRIDRIRAGLHDCQVADCVESDTTVESASLAAALQEVSAALAGAYG